MAKHDSKPGAPKVDANATPTPHDAATDGQTPDNPATTGAAINTPKSEADVQRAIDPEVKPNGDQTKVDEPGVLSKAVNSVKNAAKAAFSSDSAETDGTVTVDFGKAGKLKGGMVMNAVPGTTSFASGQLVTVVFQTDDTTSVSLAVDGAQIKA